MTATINKETSDAIYRDWLHGYTVPELVNKYHISNPKIAATIYQRESNFKEDTPAGKYLNAKKLKDVSQNTMKKIDEDIEAGLDLLDIAEMHNVRYDNIEDYYIQNYLRPKEFTENIEKYKKRYFAGESISHLKAETDVFNSVFAGILDREAIYEDFRSGMTISELTDIWGNTDIDNIAFLDSNVKVDIGRRYTKDDILKIITAKIAKGE